MRDRRTRADTLLQVQLEAPPHLFIGGLEIESEANSTIQIINPATGQRVGRCPAANLRDVEKAVEAAEEASFDIWGRMGDEKRSHLLLRIADAIEAEAEDLAILETLQTGKPFRYVLSQDIRASIDILRYFAGWSGKSSGDAHQLSSGQFGLTRRERYRTVGVILPWTQPFGGAVRKLAPALALGSCAVVKPPEQAPLTVLRLAELMKEAGLPAGVVNVITGLGAQAGEALAASRVDALAFAGSIETGRRVLVSSAKSNLKPVQLELGGKSATLIFEDADLGKAIRYASAAIFSGRCEENTAGSRLLVHETIYEEVCATIVARAQEIVVGDPLDEHTELGPVISLEHLKRVLAYVELGRREGATLVAGGKRNVDGARAHGFYVQPTVFMNVKPSMRVVREEIGGPVLTIGSFRSEEEAIELCNDTDYGLAASIWTTNLARAHRVAERIETGVVWVNQDRVRHPALPFGGRGLSGSGRDLGREAIERLSWPKSIYLPLK